MLLQRLGLPTPSDDTDSDCEGSRQGTADQPGFVHALLTLLLTADGKAGCRTAQQLELWQQGHNATVDLLDTVYSAVGGLTGWRVLSALPSINVAEVCVHVLHKMQVW